MSHLKGARRRWTYLGLPEPGTPEWRQYHEAAWAVAQKEAEAWKAARDLGERRGLFGVPVLVFDLPVAPHGPEVTGPSRGTGLGGLPEVDGYERSARYWEKAADKAPGGARAFALARAKRTRELRARSQLWESIDARRN